MATAMDEEEEEVPAAAAAAPAPDSAPVGSGAGEDEAKVAAAPPADSHDVRLQAAEKAIKECPEDYDANVEVAAAAPAPTPSSAPVGSGAGEDDAKVAAAPPAPANSFDVRLQAAEKAIKECPEDYDANVKYIWYLRKSGNIEKLRAARENMCTHFPLTPKMWQEWVHDEISSLSTSNQTFGDIEKLFERGVQEYLLIYLWWNYLTFVWWHDQSVCSYSPAGLSKMRDLCERAISAGGLHVADGAKLWAAYTSYEMSFLRTITDADEEERAKQVQRIRTLFHRQLSVPLSNMELILAAYKRWEAEQGKENDQGSDFDGIPSNVICAYKKAKDMYDERKQYEDQLSNTGASEDDKVQEYLKYIKFEESKGDTTRVQVLFERAVSDLPDSSDLWTEYTSYVDRALKVPSVLKSVYYRATRQCPLVSELWIRYMLLLERIRASEKELNHVFDEATEYTFDSIKERVDIYVARIDSLRRRMSDGLDFQLIREAFRGAYEFLEGEDLVRLCSYWAKLECNHGDGVAGARRVWEYALKQWWFPLEKIWQHYISMEIEMGNIDGARSLYKRCYRRKFYGSRSEDICKAWIRFEGEYGTLDDYDRAMRKVARWKEVSNSGAQQEVEIDHDSSSSDLSDSSDSSDKSKSSEMSNEQERPAKRRKQTSCSDASVKMLQKVHDRCQELDEQDGKYREELMNRERAKFEMQQKHLEAKLDLVQECNKLQWEVTQEHMKLQNEMAEREMKLQTDLMERRRMESDMRIMFTDLNTLLPPLRDWVAKQQMEILAREGLAPPGGPGGPSET